MSGITETFGTLNNATKDAEEALQALRNGNIPPEKLFAEYIKLRNRSDLTALYQEFSETFDSEAEIYAFQPALSEKLHGNMTNYTTAKETGFYPGLIYSNPLMHYMMRRALDKANPDLCYELYVRGINNLANETGGSTDNHYPPQKLIEEITAEPLEKIACLRPANIHILENEDDANLPPAPE